MSGKKRTVLLEAVDAKTNETRLAWASKLSERLQRDRSDVKAGVGRAHEDVPLREAVKRFFEAHPRLSEGTRRSYSTAIDTLVRGRERLTTLQLSNIVLAHWREERVNAKRRNTRRGGSRGEKAATGRLRAPASANKDLRTVGRWLEWMRGAGLVRLTQDDLRTVLRKERLELELKPFLSVQQIGELLTACAKHDSTTRGKPITPVVRFLLLTGMRLGEALALEWRDVEDDTLNVRAAVSKTRKAHKIDLSVSPTALQSLRRGDPAALVLDMTEGEARAAFKRLAEHGAPAWTPHTLRRTCGTYLTCAPSIYGAASAYMSARRLGHSVQIAETHYVGMVRISADAKTLEQAMSLE
ncbi:MAG TPA: tyrosine-type recombinase/integrase [Polyangiales bacterium]|nr:tyrosine-type recombinase/integrase [Polyangiales bacterium]